MPQLPAIFDEFIIKSKDRLNQSNLKVYCKCCIDALGEEKGKKIFFPNKTDRIVQHLRKCSYFHEIATPEIQNEIFSLLKKNEENQQVNRSCKFYFYFSMKFEIFIYIIN
jgi:hypothetical protein